MRIVITGAKGQLGHELQAVLAEYHLTLLDMPAFDVTGPDVERKITDARPNVVIHAAAFTNVDEAEHEPQRAMAVNAEGTERVARAAADSGARLVYLSTDYVFDGSKQAPYLECDEANPLNVYGRTKLEGERRALARHPNTVVVRTAWLYGMHGRNFVKAIAQAASTQSEIRVVNDQRGSPTYAGDLARAIKAMLGTDLKGVVHATGAGDCTWHEFASEIVSLIGLPRRVVQVSTAEMARPASRPGYSVLANAILYGQGIRLPHWKDALAQFLRQIKVEVEAK